MNLFHRYLCYSVTVCSWMQAVCNTVALGVTQHKLAFLNCIAVCDVGNHRPFLWQCTHTSPLQHTATCRCNRLWQCTHTSPLQHIATWYCNHLWQCTHTSPLQHTATCHCNHLWQRSHISPPASQNMLSSFASYNWKCLVQCKNRELVYWHTVFDTLSH